MIVDKIHEIILFKQSKWSEKYIDFHVKKRALATNEFQIKFHKDMPNSFYGKFLENLRNRIKVEFIKKDDNEKIVKQQSKLTFNGIHKSYENYDSYTFKQNEITMDKPLYLGFSVLELSKLHMYETYYDILQPYFGQENLQLHYMDTDSFVLSVNTKNIIHDLHNLKNYFDFSNLNKEHELFSNVNKKVLGKFKIETPKNIFIDEFIALRSKAYSFKCNNNNEDKNKLKGICKSQTKNIKFEEYKNCLFGNEYKKECDNFVIRALNHEIYMQKVTKNSLSAFDEKRKYINNIESIPWDG